MEGNVAINCTENFSIHCASILNAYSIISFDDLKHLLQSLTSRLEFISMEILSKH